MPKQRGCASYIFVLALSLLPGFILAIRLRYQWPFPNYHPAFRALGLLIAVALVYLLEKSLTRTGIKVPRSIVPVAEGLVYGFMLGSAIL